MGGFVAVNATLPTSTEAIAYDSLLATKSGFLSLGGTYNGATDLNKIFELNCGETAEGCITAEWKERTETLSTARRGQLAVPIPSDYLCCKGDSDPECPTKH